MDHYWTLLAFLTLRIGCDGVAGSNAILDQCGICNGDGSTCQLISGIFTRRYLSYGYNLISRIPAGACNINITEMSRSRNVLALKVTDGDYIFNGNFRLSRGHAFHDAGTTFNYHRNKREPGCMTQCIQAVGPTTKSIDLELLFYQMNTGIMYQFTVPNNLTDFFMRNMIPNLRPPSQTSGSRQPPFQHSQQNVHMITNPNELNRQTNNNRYQNTRVQNPLYPERQSSVRDSGRVPVMDSNLQTSALQQTPVDQNRKYSYSSELGVYKQAAKGDYGQKISESSLSNGYPVYSNGIPLAKTADGRNINSVVDNFGGVPLGGVNVNKPPLVIANNIPDSRNYFWRISGFTECSRTCGGGLQETKIICLKKDTNVMVTDSNCDPRLKPETQVLKCNKNICPPNWDSGNWSDCSVSCGQGMQTRHVLCKQLIDSDLHPEVPTNRCDMRTRPESARSCTPKPCAEWTHGNWSECSVNCGRGRQNREVYCQHINGHNTSESECNGPKPQSKKPCEMGQCAVGWMYSKWSRRCSSSCGTGVVTRRVYCAAADGTPLPEFKCSKKSKPKEKRPCRKRIPCGGIWFDGPWSKCSVTCGEGVKKRDVVCMKRFGDSLISVVGDENCLKDQKPPTTKPCKGLPKCESEWFMSSWSMCSKSCDTGSKTRQIQCLDQQLRPSSTCPADLRPSKRHTCNTASCDLPQLDEDPSCVDKLQNCKLVPQARIELCDYSFYRTACCRSCKQREHKSHFNETGS